MNYGTIQSYPLTLDKVLDHAAKWHSNAQVITASHTTKAHTLTYKKLKERSAQISNVLKSMGITLNDAVATLAWNTGEHVQSWFGIMGMGAVCHTLNPRLTPDHLIAMVQQSRARILITSESLLDLALEIADQSDFIDQILIIDSDQKLPSKSHTKLSLLSKEMAQHGVDHAWGNFDENTPSGLCFTSGSTGSPKGVTYTHRGCFLHTLRILQGDVLGITANDVVMPVVPMFHANAWGLPFAVPAVGANLVLPGRHMDGKSLANLIASQNVTIAVGVPTVWLSLCDYVQEQAITLPSLNRIIVGGAPMPPALMTRMEEQLGVRVQTSWGMTELSPVGTFATISEPNIRASVSGRPALGCDLILLDEEGQELESQRNTEGRLHVRGSSVIETYFGQDHTATNENNWFDTGDLAMIEADGNLKITGRAKDLIKSGGEWINPNDIENIICELSEISFAAVIGRQDDKWSERPVLIIELRENHAISDDALLGALRDKVASWWLPDDIIRVAQMPLAATGKINKIALRETYSNF